MADFINILMFIYYFYAVNRYSIFTVKSNLLDRLFHLFLENFLIIYLQFITWKKKKLTDLFF